MQARDYALVGIAVVTVAVLGVILPRVEEQHTQVPIEVTEEAIEDTTDFYTIDARYPREARDTEGKMQAYVEYRVNEAREEWKTGGEVERAERELTEKFPDRALPKYELIIGYTAYESQKLGTVTYVFSEYRFTGGAHGGTTLATFTFNQSGLVALEDILNFDNRNDIALTEALSKRLTEVLGENANPQMIAEGLGLAFLKPDGSFDSDKCGCDGFFFPSNFQNFIVSDDGLTFIMGQYQVAPYVVGMPEALFRWAELQPYIQSSFALPLD